MRPLRAAVLLGALAAVGIIVIRHRVGASGRPVPGGIVMRDAGAYDSISRLVLGSLFRPIAADVASAIGPGARVLEVGCGPGHLSVRMAAAHALEVIGLDLDPAMIHRARRNAERAHGHPAPSFVVGDVAALPFGDEAFDAVVSTFSMHHWDDPATGLAEIDRVLRPGGRALIWDVGPGAPLHGHVSDPAVHAEASSMRLASAEPWRWPWRLSLARRIELVKEPAAP